MKIEIIYICETCGKKSEYAYEIESCEAQHMGLTILQKRHYDNLKERVRILKSIISIKTNDKKTEDSYNNAVKNLTDFEKSNNINTVKEGK